MRKSIKKIVASVVAGAMALAMMVTPNVSAVAADGDITLYLKLTDGSANTDWAANTWGGAVTDPEATQVNKPTGWGEGTLPQLAADTEGWAKIKVNVSEGIGGWQWIKYDGAALAENGQIDCWNAAILSLGLTEAYFDLASNKWFKEKELTNEIKMKDVSKDMYIIGGGEYFGAWDTSKAVKMDADGDTYTLTIRKMAAGDYEYKFLQDAPQYQWSYQAGLKQEGEGTYVKPLDGAGDPKSITFTLKELSDVTFEIKVTSRKGGEDYDKELMKTVEISDVVVSKPAITADEVEAAIKAIGKVTLDSKKAIEAAEALYKAAPEAEQKKVTNYATLTDARKAYEELVKAEAAKGYDVTVHYNNSLNWADVKLYSFFDKADKTQVVLSSAWPGDAISADSANKGYFTAGFNLPAEAKTVGKITVVFATGTGGSEKQTANIELTLTADKNEYWISLDGKTAQDDFKNTVYTATVDTKAPAGWVKSEVTQVTTQAATEAPEDGEEDGEEETEAPDASAWEDALLKIHFLNSMEWEKVGVYLTYASWAELTGSWPGSEMQLEDGSETWYAVCTNADAEEAYNVIFNNMVSDDQANAGEAKKEQTPDTKDLAPGEYWFVLGEVTAESDTQITYGVTMFDSVEALEEAGYEYDGNGLVGDVAVEDENEDADADEDADEDEEETTAEKADGATTGDAAPIAVVLLGMVAVVAVVASKKRQNA